MKKVIILLSLLSIGAVFNAQSAFAEYGPPAPIAKYGPPAPVSKIQEQMSTVLGTSNFDVTKVLKEIEQKFPASKNSVDGAKLNSDYKIEDPFSQRFINGRYNFEMWNEKADIANVTGPVLNPDYKDDDPESSQYMGGPTNAEIICEKTMPVLVIAM